MKNKRTKLTALLLSALMAVSTISSTTWGADLFSDGVSNVEDTVETSTNAITDDNIDVEEVPLEDVYSLSQAEETPTPAAPAAIAFESYGVYKTATGEYMLDISVDGGKKEPKSVRFIKQEPATREHPKRDVCEFEYGKDTYRAYLLYDVETWNTKQKTDENHREVNITIDIYENDNYQDSPSCGQTGRRITYTICEDCGEVKHNVQNSTAIDNPTIIITTDDNGIKHYTDGNTTSVNPYFYGSIDHDTVISELESNLKKDYPKNTFTEALNLTKNVSNVEFKSKYVDSITVLQNVEFSVILLEALSHDWGDEKITTTPGPDHPDYDGPDSDYVTRANCKIVDGKPSGAMDPNRDAYYYIVKTCKRCQETHTEKVVFYHANITEAEKFYKAGEGVRGFVDSNGLPYKDSNDVFYQTIPEDKFGDVLLEDCEVGGTYYLCTTDKDYSGETIEDNSAVVETFYKAAGHYWSSLQVVKGTNVNGVNYKNWDKLLRDQKGKIVLGTEDGQTVCYSVNCTTEAYYEFTQYCLACGQYNKAVEGPRKAYPGPHIWDPKTRKLDPTLTEYTYVDEQHHLEHYFDHATCQLCYTKAVVESSTPDALKEHTFAPKEIKGTRHEPNCGNAGYFERAQTCLCLTDPKDPESFYYDESTKTTVTIAATDKHQFGDNPPKIVWSGGNDGDGAVYIENGFVPGISLHADIVRECTVCGALDSNGINTMGIGNSEGADVEINNTDSDRNEDSDHWDETTHVPGGKWCATLRVRDLKPAKTDPATGIAYRCSTAHATIYIDWVGTVDGKLVKLNEDEVDNAVKYDVPYYANASQHEARTSHTPGKPQKEGDEIITRCTVCGEIVKRETDTSSSIGVPTVSAASVDFDTVNVSWTKVEGATAYRLYYRSSDEGIGKWTKIRTFTGDTTSYAVNGLTTGSKYRFTVRAEITQDGKTTLGDYSKKGAVAVPKLTAPEIKSVTASGKTTKVTWSRVDGASGYIVFRNSQRVGTVTKGSKVTWTDKKPVSGAKYQVRAYRTEAKKNFKSDLSEPK